ALGYAPHYWHSFRRDGAFVFLPADDAARLLASGHATRPRVAVAELHPCWNHHGDPFRGQPPKHERCQHPAARRTADPKQDESVQYSYCCECGKHFAVVAEPLKEAT